MKNYIVNGTDLKKKKIVCVRSFTFYQGFSKFNQKAALAHAAEGLASQDFY